MNIYIYIYKNIHFLTIFWTMERKQQVWTATCIILRLNVLNTGMDKWQYGVQNK